MSERFQKLTMPLAGIHPLVHTLFAEMNTQRVTMSYMADKTGISHNTLRNWRRRASPTLDNISACFQVLGLELRVVRNDQHAKR